MYRMFLLSLMLCLVGSAVSLAAAYDPLVLPGGTLAAPQDFTVRDAKRAREIPIRVYLPAEGRLAPVVLFSHGLGGSREGAMYLGKQWSARGYAVVVLQHAGSDSAVWRGVAGAQRGEAMSRAASGENLRLRIGDVPAVLDQLDVWNGDKKHPLGGRLDLQRVGMSGHSFGAVTTQAVSGQRMPGALGQAADPRIRAAVIMSPSEPRLGRAEEAFGGVKLPWICLTGTKDVAQMGGRTLGAKDVEARLAVYAALPPGDKYQVVLHEAEHSAFSDERRAGVGTRNPNHHRAILALTTAFWDAFLKGDDAAKSWLNGAGPQSVLEAKDRWQRK